MLFRALKEFFIPIPNDREKRHFVVLIEECRIEAGDPLEALEIAKSRFNLTAPIIEPINCAVAQ